jgi:hypothetical protein
MASSASMCTYDIGGFGDFYVNAEAIFLVMCDSSMNEL